MKTFAAIQDDWNLEICKYGFLQGDLLWFFLCIQYTVKKVDAHIKQGQSFK